MPATVKFWVNAFIPPSVCELLGDTYAVRVEGTYPALPWPHTWYLAGDQRSFSSEIHASSRMHSEVEIQNIDTLAPGISFQWHQCGESKALNPDGSVFDRQTASVDLMSFFNLRRNETVDPEGGIVVDDPNSNLIQIDIAGTGTVPFPVAPYVPAIDYVGTLSFNPDSGEARFRGGIDGFPAYEFYVTVDNGAPIQIAAFDPTDPFELIGDAQRHVDVAVQT